MNTSSRSELSEEEVLLAFAVEPSHGSHTLEHYLNEYPEYKLALVDLSIELLIHDTSNEEEIAASDKNTVDKAWQRFRGIVDQADSVQLANSLTHANPATFKAIAIKLGINPFMLTRLRDRHIELSTIPNQFIERFANCMNTTVDLMRSFLSSEPTIAVGVSFKANVTPIATDKISFVTAVETSRLTTEQQAELKALI
jgi:hypothetical protein